MASRYVQTLRQMAQTLQKQGLKKSADVLFASAERMQRMEAHITLLHRDFVREEADPDVLDQWQEARWEAIIKDATKHTEISDADDQD